ncbi:hypothetical protein F5Y18DRAFT_428670 [Xylariaceae sp. FL1019]|nr:hypothetical protein F5Y18DRAFT_428670 [Xylariaceae sp. FL1019]
MCAPADASAVLQCARCKKKKPAADLRHCCDDTFYCSRKCERANYSKHKTACTKPKPALANKDVAKPTTQDPIDQEHDENEKKEADSDTEKFMVTGPQEHGKSDLSATVEDAADESSSSSTIILTPRSLSPIPAQEQIDNEPALLKHIHDPFWRLENGSYLHGRPDVDVYKLLIDSYRLELRHQCIPADLKNQDNTSSPTLGGFQAFLAQAKSVPKLLPSWWSEKKQAECEAQSQQRGWCELTRSPSDQEIKVHYKQSDMPKQLCQLACDMYSSRLLIRASDRGWVAPGKEDEGPTTKG